MTDSMHGSVIGIQVAYEKALLTDVELLERQARRGTRVTTADASALLARYDTSFDALPHYLQEAIDRIDLAE